MAKFKVKTAYIDKELSKTLHVNDVVEMSVRRANEVNKKGKPQNGMLQRIDVK